MSSCRCMFTITCTLATIQLAVCERYEHINNEYSVSLPSAGLLMSAQGCWPQNLLAIINTQHGTVWPRLRAAHLCSLFCSMFYICRLFYCMQNTLTCCCWCPRPPPSPRRDSGSSAATREQQLQQEYKIDSRYFTSSISSK